MLRALTLTIVFLLSTVGCTVTNTTNNKQATSTNQSVSPLLIHINQVAFEPRANKSAVIVANQNTDIQRFEILNKQKVVLKGNVERQAAFNEWGADQSHYLADFSALNKPGDYTLRVYATTAKKPLTITSSSFEIAQHAYFKKTAADVLAYFKANRYTHNEDRRIRVYDSKRYVNVWGGWMDAGGDTGKYLSHLSYANFMNPQQGAIVSWVLAKSYERIPEHYIKANLEKALVEETLWGADYLHRILDEKGFFYMTVFDQWSSGAERMITAYVGLDGVYTNDYQSAFREGGGIAIAALARAYGLSSTVGKKLNIRGEFTAEQYLADAEKAFAHLQKNNTKYCDDGKENIIDDYTALIAATELYRATQKPTYLAALRKRVDNLVARVTTEGWFISDDGNRPYFHAVEAGMPILALVDSLNFENKSDRIIKTKAAIKAVLDYQLQLNNEVSNPFNYARQRFKPYKNKQYGKQTSGFFIPHANETNYWWQGESARLASLSAAAIWGGQVSHSDNKGLYGITPALANFAQHQVDWILGRNPYDICMLYGFGVNNPPYAKSGGDMVKGGISNGITGATASDEGRGITWAEGPDSNNWRWVEQWLQHSTWYLLAITAMAENTN